MNGLTFFNSPDSNMDRMKIKDLNDDIDNYLRPEFIKYHHKNCGKNPNLKNIIIKKEHPLYPNNHEKSEKILVTQYYSDYLMKDDEYNTEEEYETDKWIEYKKSVLLNYNK